jgi:uncharacterized protein (TIGR00730 family)
MSKFPIKAYKNSEFLNSSEARTIRILCEYEEPKRRFETHGITDTVVFFGSARTKPGDVAAEALEAAGKVHAASGADEAADAALKKAQIDLKMSRYYDEARELARRITEWSLASQKGRFVITSGGGPGIMEAANRGAADVDGGRSVGLGISLPFEAGVNDWVTDGLDFEFHYFFTRKYWFLYLCKALVIFPGGFGTMDELFETLTLIQTDKIKKDLPIVLYGKAYWDAILNMEAMAEFGTISPGDVDLFHRVDSVEEAFAYLSSFLEGKAPSGSVLSRDD